MGFVVLKEGPHSLLLEHLYLRPDHQQRGIGSAVLASLFDEADRRRMPLRVVALRDSAANRFYQRHGFWLVGESSWDLEYERAPGDLSSVRPNRPHFELPTPKPT